MPTLTIPGWRPCPLNVLLRAHWSRVQALKGLDRHIVAVHAAAQWIPKATGKRRVSLRVTYRGRQQARDPDALWKSTLDALVACGLLIDDSPRWCELGSVVQKRGERECTEITLEDIGP